MSASAEAQPYYSRKGYVLKDLARNFVLALNETSPESSGRLLHYTADMVASGGFELWQRLCLDFAADHIGIASPRIFVYLKQKFSQLTSLQLQLPFQRFISSTEVQRATAEVVLIIQGCPKRGKVKLPAVPADTHLNNDWLYGVARSPDKIVVKKIWNPSSDRGQLYSAMNEMMNAITDNALEKALFWLRWIIEEDILMRKRYGSGITSQERGPGTLGIKQRTHPGFFICAVLAEAYKELAATSQVRLHEEFQTLLDIYRATDKLTNAKRKQDALILMIQILTEVPRWRVPAAPTLIKDPIVLSRAVSQVDIFYNEILALPLPAKPLPTRVGSLAVKKVKEPLKQDSMESHLSAVDQAIMDFYGRF